MHTKLLSLAEKCDFVGNKDSLPTCSWNRTGSHMQNNDKVVGMKHSRKGKVT